MKPKAPPKRKEQTELPEAGTVLVLKPKQADLLEGEFALVRKAYERSYWDSTDIQYFCTLVSLSESMKTVSNLPIRELPEVATPAEVKKLIPEPDRAALLKAFKAPVYRSDICLGTDPEVFVEIPQGQGWQVVPAWAFLPSKEQPLRAQLPSGTNHRCEIFWDGVQAEWNTASSFCLGWLTDHVQRGLQEVLEAAREKWPRARLSIKSTYDLPEGIFNGATREQAGFGCAPSENAYGDAGDVVDDPAGLLQRWAGGHMHWGFEGGKNASQARKVRMVKLLDAYLATACVSLSEGWDDPRRRRYYGLAGEYRPKSYGFEYRVLSNFWLIHPVLLQLVWETARYILRMEEGLELPDEYRVRAIINANDVDEARKFLAERKWLYRGGILGGWMANITTAAQAKVSPWDVIIGGARQFFDTDLTENWLLEGRWQQHMHGSLATWCGYNHNQYAPGILRKAF